MLMADNKRMQQRIKAMQETINNITQKNVDLLSEKETYGWSSTSKCILGIIKFAFIVNSKSPSKHNFINII